VYENKGWHDKMPEKNSDFVSESAEFARNFGVFTRNFTGFAHENRSWVGLMSALGEANSPLHRTPDAVAGPEEQDCHEPVYLWAMPGGRENMQVHPAMCMKTNGRKK